MQKAKNILQKLNGEICVECLIVTLFLGVMILEVASLA